MANDRPALANGGTPPSGEPGTNSGRDIADLTANALSWASEGLRAHPTVASVLLGTAGIGAAMAIGVGELAVGVAIGYAAYLVLADGESPIQALRDAFALERGEVEEKAR